MNYDIKNTDLIVIIDNKGKIMYYNNFRDRINKLKEVDTIGRNIWEIYPWVNEETPLFRTMKLREPIMNEILDITIDGNKTISALNSAYPLENSKGVFGAIGFSTSTEKTLNNPDSKRKQTGNSATYVFDDIITVNKNMITLKENLAKISKTDSNVFLFGASGTGKELFAHSIHNSSPRWNKPFIAQNCGAIPSTLVESTFFGTDKGSFTGSENKQGLFDIADGGTLFLDEINSMPLELQGKLLRVLEENSFRRVGSTEEVFCDVRIISASNMNLDESLDDIIRSDLFYRLSVINIRIPPLAKRIDDIEVLCDYYISFFNNVFNKNVKAISVEATKIILNYDWPGNVRELKNVMEYCFNVIEEDIIDVNHLPKRLIKKSTLENKIPNFVGLVDNVEAYEKSLISKALLINKYNIVNSAKYLNIPRQTLYYKLNKYDLMK